MGFLLGTRVNGQPSAAEIAKRQRVAQIYDGPTAVDHAANEPNSPDGHTDPATDHVAEDDAGFHDAPADTTANRPDRHRVKSAGPIGDAIQAHNAHAPNSRRAGRELVGHPTSQDRAPMDPTGGTEAPGAPSLSDDRAESSRTPDSLSTGVEADRGGPDRPQTRAPKGLDYGARGDGVQVAGRNADGSFMAPHDVAVQKLDLTNSVTSPATFFRRPFLTGPGHEAISPSTHAPNVAANERTTSR